MRSTFLDYTASRKLTIPVSTTSCEIRSRNDGTECGGHGSGMGGLPIEPQVNPPSSSWKTARPCHRGGRRFASTARFVSCCVKGANLRAISSEGAASVARTKPDTAFIWWSTPGSTGGMGRTPFALMMRPPPSPPANRIETVMLLATAGRARALHRRRVTSGVPRYADLASLNTSV
jgi:hypothetical protein